MHSHERIFIPLSSLLQRLSVYRCQARWGGELCPGKDWLYKVAAYC